MSDSNILEGRGQLILRRPLPASEVHKHVLAAREATRATRDFYTGLGASLASMLMSPKFVFDIDVLENDPAARGRQRLDAYSKASRLTLFLWNTTPDAALLEAAERGDLHSAPRLAQQVDRLLASPRVDSTIKAFVSAASGGTDGCELNDLVSLERAVRDSRPVPECLAGKFAEHAIRRPLRDEDARWSSELTARVVKNGYQVRALLREIATSDAFFRVPASN